MSWALDLARQKLGDGGTQPLFGVILYTDSHANLKKVLRDEDYWRALDELSGPQWFIFSVRARPGHWEYPSPPPGVLAMMIPVWKEPAANRELLETFEIEDTSKLPALVVFAFDGADLFRSVIPLKDSTIESTYSTIKTVVAKIGSALERGNRNARDSAALFAAVDQELRDYRDKKRIRNAYEVLKTVREWLPL
jgi:hypothetical protein